MEYSNRTKKLWTVGRTKKSLILFSAGLIVISLLRLAVA